MDTSFYTQIKDHLVSNILPFWEKYGKDPVTEDFCGSIDSNCKADNHASRSALLPSDILWTYSSAARLFISADYMKTAEFAFLSLKRHFFDTLNGGFYWTAKADGTPENTEKQTAAQAAALYGLCEYAAALKEVLKLDYPATVVMDRALAVYSLLERYAKDTEHGGYITACTETWQPEMDAHILPEDTVCIKSADSNLRVLQAYTNLHRTLVCVYPEQTDLQKLVGASLKELVLLLADKAVTADHDFGRQYDMEWKQLGCSATSFGKSIEASWQLWDAANELADDDLLEKMRPVAVDMARSVLASGFDRTAGALENAMQNGKKDTDRIQKNQAEALVGFYNAWELTGGEDFKMAFQKKWNWVTDHQADKANGEWYDTVDTEGKPDLSKPKGGSWKSCLSNARACMELLRRSGTALR